MSRIGESPSGLYLMSAFPPPLKAVLYVPLDNPRTGQPIKQTSLAGFRQYLTLWKSNCVQQIIFVVGGGGVSAVLERLTRLKAVTSQVLWGIICEVADGDFSRVAVMHQKRPRCPRRRSKTSLQSNPTSACETANAACKKHLKKERFRLVILLLPLLGDDFDSVSNCHDDKDRDYDVNMLRKCSWIPFKSRKRRSVFKKGI